MKVIDVKSNGATVQLTDDELCLLASLSVEIFGGAFIIREGEWSTVPMGGYSYAEADEFMREFREIFAKVREANPN